MKKTTFSLVLLSLFVTILASCSVPQDSTSGGATVESSADAPAANSVEPTPLDMSLNLQGEAAAERLQQMHGVMFAYEGAVLNPGEYYLRLLGGSSERVVSGTVFALDEEGYDQIEIFYGDNVFIVEDFTLEQGKMVQIELTDDMLKQSNEQLVGFHFSEGEALPDQYSVYSFNSKLEKYVVLYENFSFENNVVLLDLENRYIIEFQIDGKKYYHMIESLAEDAIEYVVPQDGLKEVTEFENLIEFPGAEITWQDVRSINIALEGFDLDAVQKASLQADVGVSLNIFQRLIAAGDVSEAGVTGEVFVPQAATIFDLSVFTDDKKVYTFESINVQDELITLSIEDALEDEVKKVVHPLVFDLKITGLEYGDELIFFGKKEGTDVSVVSPYTYRGELSIPYRWNSITYFNEDSFDLVVQVNKMNYEFKDLSFMDTSLDLDFSLADSVYSGDYMADYDERMMVLDKEGLIEGDIVSVIAFDQGFTPVFSSGNEYSENGVKLILPKGSSDYHLLVLFPLKESVAYFVDSSQIDLSQDLQISLEEVAVLSTLAKNKKREGEFLPVNVYLEGFSDGKNKVLVNYDNYTPGWLYEVDSSVGNSFQFDFVEGENASISVIQSTGKVYVYEGVSYSEELVLKKDDAVDTSIKGIFERGIVF